MKNYVSKHIILILLLSITTQDGIAHVLPDSSKIVINQGFIKSDITHKVWVHYGMENEVEFFNQIEQLKFSQNKKHKIHIKNGGINSWFLFKIKNNQDVKQRLVLESHNFIIIDFNAYLLSQNKIIKSMKAGTNIPFHKWPIKFRYSSFPIELNPYEEQTVVIKGRGDFDCSATPLRLWNDLEFQQYAQKSNSHIALIGGLIFISICFSLIMAIVIKETIYKYYFLYSIIVLLLLITNSNFGFQFFYPSWTKGANTIPLVVGIIGSLVMIKILIEYFIEHDFAKKIKQYNWLLLVITLIGITQHILRPFLFQYNLHVSNWGIAPGVFPVIFVFVTLYLIVKGLFEKPTIERWILLSSYLVLFISTTVNILSYQGVIVLNIDDIYILPLAFLFELFCLLIILLRRAIGFYQQKQNAEIQLERMTFEKIRAEDLEKLDSFKTRFYTNITHEFRTPLTVIKGMTKRIKENEEEKTMISRNSDDLLNLVDQMLELSKLESGNLPIKMVNGDIISFLKYLTESLHSLAEAKGVELKTESTTPSLSINYDKEKLTHIVKNLLVNAIKFTPQGGEVILKINNNNNDTKTLSFSVTDTGKGIAPEDLPNIFDRFYQSEDAIHQGSGIGLALTHELVKLLGGSIQVETELEKGTTFNLQFPITQNEKSLLEDKERFLEKTSRTNTFYFEEKINKSSEQPILLIIEDSEDVVQYLKLCLSANYQIQTASNGKEGMKKAIELIPDIIISDVMMPEADGFEVCNFLKNDIRTSHIPLILLTAKADIESKLTGLTRGADAYLAKPFEEEELKIRMNKMLDLRKRLQEKYSNSNFSQQYTSESEFKKENQFIIELKELILEKMDTDIDYDELARLVGMSRSQFYRKIKALTDCSPSIFIRSIKLRHGDELLRTTDLTVSEVAFQTGFKDVAYFSRSYKKQFGTTPTERRHV